MGVQADLLNNSHAARARPQRYQFIAIRCSYRNGREEEDSFFFRRGAFLCNLV